MPDNANDLGLLIVWSVVLIGLITMAVMLWADEIGSHVRSRRVERSHHSHNTYNHGK